MKKIALVLVMMIFVKIGLSQDTSKKVIETKILHNEKTQPLFSFKNGLGVTTPDSSWSINIRFRMQNRFMMSTVSDEDLSPKSWEARVRRCRLSFTGHMYNPKWTYYLQLSFSKGDMDWSMTETSSINNSPNVVRDAMIFYKPTKHWQLALGQGKLPGNRQRVVSSGALQFYDRSIVNSNFTFDRDFGFFSNYSNKIGTNFKWIFKTAITSGEGRNSTTSNPGLAYTGRLELLPFGDFTDGGDYFEGDVVREEKIKVSLAGSYCFNDLSARTQGQLGKDLYQNRSTHGYEADLLIKYKGLAISSEYIRRDAEKGPVTHSSTGASSNIIVGDGINTQLSYCFKNHFEIAARHSLVSPHADLFGKMNQQEQFGLGITKYMMRHKFKIQYNVFYNRDRDLKNAKELNKYFFSAFQIEMGI